MWYYMKDGRQMGPVGDDEMKSVAAQGGLAASDLVWREGMAAWQPASAVPELAGSMAPTPPTPAPPAPAAMAPAPPPPAYADPQFAVAPGGPQGTVIPDYLPWAIAVTLLCCPPTGLASIIFASRANTAKTQNDWTTAEASAKQAKTWLIASVVGGFLWIGIVAAFYIIGLLAAVGAHAR